MDVDEVLDEDFDDGSDDADNEFQYLNDPSSTQPSSGPPSTPNSCTSSPPINNSDESPVSTFYSQNGNALVFGGGGKPGYGARRGPGRPRKEYPGMRGAMRDARAMYKRCRGGVFKGVSNRKKFPGKDERQGSILNNNSSQSQEGSSLLTPSTSPPTEFPYNSTESSNVLIDMADKAMQVVEEPPYFPEKWPGKVCALCNLGERSQLGQGEMLRMEISEEEQELFRTDSPNSEEKEAFPNDMNTNSSTFPQFSNRRQKGLNKCKNPVNTSEYVDELDKIGHFESTEMSQILDCNYYYIHRSCATWSSGVVRDSTGALGKVANVVFQSLRRKCTYCGHFGASVACKMACPKFFHFPCVAASGGFQTIQTYVSFCKEHLGQVPIICTDDINCRSCCGIGDVSNLVMCSICGDHYHGTCIGLPQLPGVRAGWQCTSCHKCQICRVPDTNEGRSLSCEQCHKVYHANCLRPIMSSIPKYGWKCRRCRVCSDCGSRTPGAGASSRWHAHYTVCDSCYQQRNKGFSCPICHRAYRAAAYREMVKCSLCNKFVHSTCDSEADLAVYHARKENNPDYDYVCPPCKQLIQSGRLNQSIVRRNSHYDEEMMLNSQDSSQCGDELESPEALEKNNDFGLGKGKPYAMKISKKRIGQPFGQVSKAKGKLGFGKRSRLSELGRKRGPKAKMRGIFGVPGLSLQRPAIEANKVDDEPGIENRLVLCSAKDKFILTQDICVMCGAIGTDYEGCLISCAQCGQCYHPYCVNVKITKVILKKGWRCLDCTVCEGCGQKNDEARLILCDECDISFHIYCMDPPLDVVPQGNWKCKWCATCQKCGRETPGKNCTWKNSYSECGPCASLSACGVCSEAYNEGELIIQCANCERFLHCKCDSIKNEEEADKCNDDNYHCVLCRPKDLPPLHLMPVKNEVPAIKAAENPQKIDEPTESVVYHGLEGSHFIDGVFLSEHGLNSIKALQMEYTRKKRKQKAVPESSNNKDAGILASIESVVAGSGVDALNEETKVELLDPKEEAEIYKDGMVWERSDGSPPEGFALCTNEQGVVVLRKKRQRNLQKLGIGGFNVRNRAMKKDKDDLDDHADHTAGGGGGSNENTPTDKKKRPIRKRQKNKLAETYPTYLQDAFFGRHLLDAMQTNFESDSSEDDTKSNVSEDKIIKLSPEELKMLESMKTENKVSTPQPTPPILSSNTFADMKSILVKANTSESAIPSGLLPVIPQADDDNDTDADTLKDILPQDLLDSDLVDSIINDNDDLVKSELGVQYDGNLGSRKDDLPDILGPNFSLDPIEINSKDVEEIFQGVINPQPKQYSNVIKQERPVISLTNNQFPKANTAEIQYVSNGIMEDVKPPLVMNSFLPVQQTFPNSNDIKTIDQVQVHSSSTTPTQNYVNANSQNSNSNSSLSFASNSSVPNVWSSNSQSPRQSADFTATQSEEPAASTPAPQTCTMKSTERMRRDEELGEMATISAVLYANTNHPELKQDYPNWPDRQKQIYKRWRALSNEKKAPFLQQARDNRTALRMRKNQQAADNDKEKNPNADLLGGTDSGDLDLSTDLNDEDDSTSRLSSCSSSLDIETNNKSSSTFDLRENSDDTDTLNNTKQTLRLELSKDNMTANKSCQSTGTSTPSTGVAIRYKLNVIKENALQAPKRSVELIKETSQVKRSTFPKFYISTNMSGPAPNVTVNANGAFNTGSKSVLHTYCATRPITNHFLVMNKTPVQRLSVEVPNIGNCMQKDGKQVLIRGVINEALQEDARAKQVQVGNKKILHINPTTEFLDLNGKKLSTSNGGSGTAASNSIYLDQNIRVLTPSEIMKTLPIIPGQDSIPSAVSSSSAPSTTAGNDFTNRIIAGACSLDQEKMATQQKSLKEQEQERQWKQLQAMRAKEQQLQQFPTQVSGQTSPSLMSGGSTPTYIHETISLEKRSPYGSIPGTPRPQFNTDVIQPTVYATSLDSYQPPTIQLNATIQEKLGPAKQPENNKQLRDLLQRQESIGGLINNPNTVLNVTTQGTQQIPGRWNSGDENSINSNQTPTFGGSTFREPFPVTLQGRNPKILNNTNAIRLPVGNATMTCTSQQPPFSQQPKMNISSIESQCDTEKKLTPGEMVNQKLQQVVVGSVNMQSKMKIKENLTKVVGGVGNEIPDNVTAELEKLEQDENVTMGEVEGVGDILGGLGEDDDDELLKSLTADLGDDFNILEYADPALDQLAGGDNQNLLDKLDFDEGDPDVKKTTTENKYANQRPEAVVQMERQNIIQPTLQNQIITQPPSRYNSTIAQTTTLCAMPARSALAPPPPPYPGPPPPYPANTQNIRQQNQPLLLEDLVEQEKREQQQQQQLTSSIVAGQLNDKKTFVAKVDGNVHRSNAVSMANAWRKNVGEVVQTGAGNVMMNVDQKTKKEIPSAPVLNFNFQPPPPQPPDNIVTEQDRIMQINYEQWLNTQNTALENQLKYFDEKITKIRKIRKSLNSKQRNVKKSGGELLPHDAKELAKIIAEQPGIQKQLDNAKKQYRQHGLLMQDYKAKHLSKIQMPSPNIPSPAQMAPHSPMLSPSTASQSSLLMRTSPSPLSTHMLQSTRSPIQSPSPLLSHSPGGISQSPVHQSNSNPSPFNTVQTSPRIGTPHSQMDENSFSPSATMSSPSSLPGRHASPAPRITSPQHRINVQQIPNRIATSPGHSYNTIIPSQNSKFNAPHIPHDRIRVQIGQQQQHQLLHQAQMSLDGSQQQHQIQPGQQQQQQIVTSLQMSNIQQHNSDMLQTQRINFLHQRQIMQRQGIIGQVINKPKSQQQQQQQQQQQHHQNHVSSQSPSHVSPAPSSPLLQCQIQQSPNTNNFVLNSPEQHYLQQCGDGTNTLMDLKNFGRSSQESNNNANNNGGGGGGGGLSSLTSRFLPYTGGGTSSRYGKIRLGLFGGSPMWNLANNINQKLSMERAKCNSESTSINLDKVEGKEKTMDSSASMATGNSIGSNQLAKGDDDVVIIDSSPEEKQRMMDYDDYQDKGLVATEVSLSSVAQNIGDNDDITVIESFPPSALTEMVPSPLDHEVAEEYVLFSSDVVGYADDDPLKQNIITQSDDISKTGDNSFEKEFDMAKQENKLDGSESSSPLEKTSKSSCVTSANLKRDQTLSVSMQKSSQDSNSLSTSQDFEAMIDSKGLDETIVSTKGTSIESISSSVSTVSTSATKQPHVAHISSSGLMTINRIPFTTVQGGILSCNLTQTTNATSLKVTPKKVNDVSTTTTKVSFANATISVPILKNVTLNSSHILAADKQGKIPTSITLSKQPTILNVRGAKLNPGTIVSLSSLQLKSATNTKIVQAAVMGKKLQIPQTSVDTLTNAKQNLIHTLSYHPTLPTLTVLQELPTKIFENEPTSPENPAEQDDVDSALGRKADADLPQSVANKTADSSVKPNESPAHKADDVKINSTNRGDSTSQKDENATKSNANSNCTKDPQKLQTRLISIVPQLSPLSQPTEMTTNMANVSQQLRTIMSSINSSQHDQKPQCENELKKESSRLPVESKVEKTLQAMHQQQQPQQHQSAQQLQQQPQQHQSAQQLQQHQNQQQLQQSVQTGDEQSEAKASTQTNDLAVTMTKPGTTSTNKVTFLLTSTSGSSNPFQTIMNSGDLHAKKPKVVPTSVLTTRLPSAIVMTTIPSTVSASQSQQTSSDSMITTQSGQDASKKSLKPVVHGHITASHLKRSKSTDDGFEREKEVPAQITGAKRYSLEVAPSKVENSESSVDNSAVNQSQGIPPKANVQIQTTKSGDQSFNGCKISSVVTQPAKSDDSQNVLLKQLLQNSAATSNAPSASHGLATRKVPGVRAPSLGLVSSLEAQLARPVIPPVPATASSILTATPTHANMKANMEVKKTEVPPEDNSKKPVQVISRETSFVSNPVAKPPPKTPDPAPFQEKPYVQQQQQQQQQQHHQQLSFEYQLKTVAPTKSEIKTASAPKISYDSLSSESKTPKQDEEMRKTPSLNDSFDTSKSDSNESPSLKRLNSTSLQYSTNMESAAEDAELTMKEEKVKATDIESSIELKKKKKREYQKNRRQMQLLNKDLSFSKKRARKISKTDGDYDMFIDNLMTQLRQMPALQVLEPLLSRNYGICPPFGAGDLAKISSTKEGAPQSAEMLGGDYGTASSTNIIDFYNTKPFGPMEMPPEQANTTIQNGFYDQEFPPIKFETDNDDRMDYSFRDCDVDTPESIVTSSSPECAAWEPIPFPGLQLISEDDDDDEAEPYSRMSPIIHVVAPIPIKLKTGIDLSIDRKLHDNNKENSLCNDWKNRGTQPVTPAKDPNVTVTLTLTSSAAEDIMGVLRDLANILHIPAPTSYQIVERTTTPPSQKLGLYRTKGKDGKEGDPVDIQTILNGAAKFCRHCDVVILNTIIRAKATEFPLLASNNELLNSSDDLYFCSKSCYKQFKWRPTNIIDDNYNLNSKLNIALDSNRGFAVDGYSDVKSIKVEHPVEVGKSARTASAAGLDDIYHKSKIMKMSHESANSNNTQQQLDDRIKSSHEKPSKPLRYRYYTSSTPLSLAPKYKKPSEKEITDMLFRMNITVAPANKMPDDTRQCIFCNQIGDGVADGPSRLLNFDVDKWVHLNCALWSDGVYETENGALMNLEAALQVSLNQTCTLCHHLGATIKCFKNRCGNVYHLSCAMKDNCTFYKNKTTHCMAHVLKNEKENELTTLSVQRRVYVDRDESRQVAAIMHHSELSNLLRVGSLTFLNVGQLLPHQLQAFHTPNYIYPIGYKIIRFYWSMRKPNKRCRYICSIADVAGRPEFRVIVQEPSEEDIELRDATPKAVWQRILGPLSTLRKDHSLVQHFPKFVTGEDLFGLTEPAVVRILESLPGIETLTDYRFKYGRNPLLELPLAINPSGAARSEPKQKQTVGWRKPHTQRTGSTNQRIPLAPTTSVAGEVACPYSKQFVHSKSSQYKKMKQEWRNNVFLARSKIQGLGLYAARDLEKHTMVIEYIGEVIRSEVSELREKQYEARNRGIYMFRLDEDRVVDATLSGGLARYINHSCNPNCVTEIVEVDREYRIIIFAKRRINRGEELSYDYKFDIEDDAHKISCMCGAPNCRKWMN